MLKRFLSLFLCMVLLLSNLPVVSFATEMADHEHNFVSDVCVCGAVKISKTTFPDANFRAYIRSSNDGSDGVLTSEELNSVTGLFLVGLDIKDLTGIEYFTALDELNCVGNQLTSLDLSSCAMLTWLACVNNQLTSLDVSNCAALTYLCCAGNQLTSLDLSDCTALTDIECGGNQLTNLDLSKCVKLEYLSCYRNQLEDLDLSNCSLLEEVICNDNQLKNLNVVNCTYLETLNCENNQLTNLNINECTRLWQMNCAGNQLTSLDLKECTSLINLECDRNSCTVFVAENQFDLSNLVKDGFDITKASNWKGGTANGNILTVTADKVTYTYDLGNDESEIFTLVIDRSCSHSWIDASCTVPKICKTCGTTMGDKLPHVFDQEKVDPKYLISDGVYYKSCVCGATGTETFTVKEDKPEDKPVINFKDVPSNAFYYDAVLWAVEKGITTGTGADTFSPDEVCNRGQVVTFLWRAAGKPEPTKTENPFTDVKTTDFFYKAVLWAKENGITTGTSATAFSPNENCNRGQVVTFLSRALKGEPKKTDNPFTDVAAGAFYYNPVLWAVENGITTGTGADTFSPNEDCNRGQVITFLYRAYK